MGSAQSKPTVCKKQTLAIYKIAEPADARDIHQSLEYGDRMKRTQSPIYIERVYEFARKKVICFRATVFHTHYSLCAVHVYIGVFTRICRNPSGACSTEC